MSQPMVQFMPQASYANFPTMSASYQPSANFVPMNYNNSCSRQLLIQHTAAELSSCRNSARSYASWLLKSRIGSSADEPCPTGWWATSSNEYTNCWRSYATKTLEAYQQVPPIEIQPVHRLEADAYWTDKIAEIMRDQFGIKTKVNSYSYRTPYPPAYDLIPLPN